MQLHELRRGASLRYKKTRVGRGGKRGTTSGHGTKGQKSRAGHRIRPAVRDLVQRLPKLRGVKNPSTALPVIPVNLRILERFASGSVVDPRFLAEKGVVRDGIRRIKIVDGRTELTKPFIIKGLKVSAGARKTIEAAGGKIVE